MKKIIVAALGIIMLLSFLANGKHAAAVTTPVPQRIPVEYEWKTVEEYGANWDKGAFKINIGNRTGTLALKLYFTEQYGEGHANSLYLNTKNKHEGGYSLGDKNTGLDDSWKLLAAFNRYRFYPEILDYKYTSGFAGADTNAKGEKFITLGVYLEKAKNNGIYYLDIPNGMNKGTWKVKAYFYDKVNVEKLLFLEIGRFFPLLGKVWWDEAELTPGQIGRLTVLKETKLYKLDGETKVYSRTLKAGEFYRIYAFKPGMLSVGGGYYVDRDSTVNYETPSKAKLDLVQMRAE